MNPNHTFGSWSFGRKTVFVSVCLAVVSLFFNWVDLGIFSENGFEQQAYLLLICFLYPIAQLVQNGPVNKLPGYICAIAGVVCGIAYINWKSVDFLGTTVNAAGSGPYVFIVASVILALGVYKSSNR